METYYKFYKLLTVILLKLKGVPCNYKIKICRYT